MTQENGTVRFRWEFAAEEKDEKDATSLALISQDGAELDPEVYFAEPTTLLIIAGAVSVGYLVRRIVSAAKDAKYGGMAIMCENGESKIVKDHSLERGKVLVVPCPPEKAYVLDASDDKELETIGKIVDALKVWR